MKQKLFDWAFYARRATVMWLCEKTFNHDKLYWPSTEDCPLPEDIRVCRRCGRFTDIDGNPCWLAVEYPPEDADGLA